ncbi:MAG: patatin-like phospholipase family protein [Promethearchaeota archaeon]|jgi:NTE family protein
MRALVLSGGGSKGAFQVGALQHLMVNLGRQYKVYCGVSVGAINCGYLAMYPEYEGISAAMGLHKLWKELNTKKVYKRWCPFGKLHALWKKSLYNSKPLKDLLRREIDVSKLQNSGNKLRVGAVSLNTGDYRLFTELDDSIVKGVIASSAFPGALAPAKIDNQIWTDGGIRNVTPLKAAIDAGADEIDVILTFTKDIKQDFENDDKTISLMLKVLDVMVQEIMDNDLEIAEMINEQVRQGRTDKKEIKINIIRPEVSLSGDSLDFDPKLLSGMMNIGDDVAKKYKF